MAKLKPLEFLEKSLLFHKTIKDDNSRSPNNNNRVLEYSLVLKWRRVTQDFLVIDWLYAMQYRYTLWYIFESTNYLCVEIFKLLISYTNWNLFSSMQLSLYIHLYQIWHNILSFLFNLDNLACGFKVQVWTLPPFYMT